MKKRLLCAAFCLVLALAQIGCGKSENKKTSEKETSPEENENYMYTISACLSESNAYEEMLYNGFRDALTDYIGAEHLDIRSFTCSENTPSDLIALTATNGNYDLIFTTGKPTLISTTTATDTIPIVATGIVDFQTVLRIAPNGDKSWDRTTGMNVTGVSSKPSIVDQVSLLIESTKDLEAVGILFSPEDTEAIYQNEIFEKYLDQAGIPWKEYMIPATTSAISEESDQNSTALTPTKMVAGSAKSGVDNDVISLGEDWILGINSPASTRIALVSKHWTGGKKLPVIEEELPDDEAIDEESSEDIKDDSSNTDSKKSEDVDSDSEGEVVYIPTLEDRISEACNECSAIYIPFGSMLSDQMQTISDITTARGVVTVAGDTTVGEYTLTTLFYDPYSLGYSAGKKAVSILRKGSNPATMKISYGSSENSVKLYNSQIAELLGLSFPKSFSEIHSFLDNYEYGSTTTRYTNAQEEEN